MDWQVTTDNHRTHQMTVLNKCEIFRHSIKSKTLEKAKYIFDNNIQYENHSSVEPSGQIPPSLFLRIETFR